MIVTPFSNLCQAFLQLPVAIAFSGLRIMLIALFNKTFLFMARKLLTTNPTQVLTGGASR